MSSSQKITSPADPQLNQLCHSLTQRSGQLAGPNAWPAEQLQLCADYGVYEWFLDDQCGGGGWSDADIYRGYIRLSAACLTTAFVITQLTGACRRIAAVGSPATKQQLLPQLLSGDQFATLAISHLTTSRRHLARPVLLAELTDDHIILNGFSPWVTGSPHANIVVTGASTQDGQQIMLVVPADTAGITVDPTAQLVGLTASQTGPIRFDNVRVSRDLLLAGPADNVMKSAIGAKSGGLQTSALAIGLCHAAVEFISDEAEQRDELGRPAAGLRDELAQLETEMLSLADGKAVCSNEQIRTRANSLVLRSTQAALAAAKGTGYVQGHPTGRWCQEAMFFLVWSCPQPVMEANLCELAGIAS